MSQFRLLLVLAPGVVHVSSPSKLAVRFAGGRLDKTDVILILLSLQRFIFFPTPTCTRALKLMGVTIDTCTQLQLQSACTRPQCN